MRNTKFIKVKYFQKLISSKYEYLERIFFDAILHEDDESGQEAGGSEESKYEKIGDYRVKDYVERPHEYKK